MRRLIRQVALLALLVPGPAVGMERLSVEGALTSAMNFPSGAEDSGDFLALGFTGIATYEVDRWAVGVRGYGTYGNKAQVHILAEPFDLRGSLARRKYGLGFLARYFFPGDPVRKSWYLSLGFNAVQSDFIDADS